jgi:hypothetical protein
MNDDEHPVFWGYFPAYDWIVFSWLFGSMNDLPFAFPQLCLDIHREATPSYRDNGRP